MSDEPKTPESELCGVSIRAWIVGIVTITLCLIEFARVAQAIYQGTQIDIVKEPFYGVVFLVIGFYFGQKTPKQP